LGNIPRIDLILSLAVMLAAILAVIAGRRGGRFRGLPGWAGYWVVFAGILVALSRLHRGVAFTLLGLSMFAAVRAFFFVAPLRPRDRNVVLATYLAIPLSLWPAFNGWVDIFSATVPLALFLFIPVFLSRGDTEKGLLDSMGRTLLGLLFFVFCFAHLGLLVHQQPGMLELFGVMVLAAELPRRLLWRSHGEPDRLKGRLGIVLGAVLAAAVGYWLGPWCSLGHQDAARAGLLVAIAVALGARVSEAVRHDLELTAAASSHGRGAFLTRTVPAAYAAPVFFHYLNTFA
jgi:predicted CDP-diglyceride synthetase/phosphatidate cytidylyltransferase